MIVYSCEQEHVELQHAVLLSVTAALCWTSMSDVAIHRVPHSGLSLVDRFDRTLEVFSHACFQGFKAEQD